MKSIMRIALVGLLAISTVSYANGGKHKGAKAKKCPATCTKTQCDKSCAGKVNCNQSSCTHKM
jgi:hypothetical protein